MGNPALYRWLLNRYPNTLCSVVEDDATSLDSTKPNPNGVEFHNLYINLKGIIHACFRPINLPESESYDDVFCFVMEYIDRVFSVVRPRKLLYLALDGVAPQAKMNHQRKRRFRAAKEAACKGKGKPEGAIKLDSNVITPGTEFMDLLSRALKYFMYCRVNTDPGWRGIKVIISDSTVVGEGEDKIMSYIRSQRNLPGYDPNTRHCLCGLDEDLVMLALSTHEIHISILRESITIRKKYKDTKLLYSECMREVMIALKFEFFNIWVLREYLERELLPNVEGTDFERLIDDFVFMCLFAENDILPPFLSLNVSQGGIEKLLMIYQQEFVKMGYITNAPEVNLKSLQHFIQALSSHNNTIFMTPNQLKMETKKRSDFQDSHDQLKIAELDLISAPIPDTDTDTNPNPGDGDVYSTINKVKINDKYEHKHYTTKFDCKSHDIDRIKRYAVLKYTEGICWIMQYYYQQVPSWQWFYPYYYAPLTSDFCDIDKLEINFTLGQPLKPLDQLLAVLPAASAHALPLFYRELMTNESSPILDFYPKDARFDRYGKRHAWQDVLKLPFIDESRLLSEIMKVEHTLTDEERQRNKFGRDMLFVHSSHPLAEMIKDLPSSEPSSEVQIQIKPDLSDGMNGDLCISDKPVFPTDIPSPFVDKPAVKMNCVKSVDYKCPSHAHIPKLPCGVIMPPKILRRQDMPRPLVSCHAKKRKQGAGYFVDHAATPHQRGNKDKGKKQNVIHGKPEAERVVDGSRNHLTAEKSTKQTEAQQQHKAGNDGMSDGMPRDDKQVKETGDEKLINVGICEKPSAAGDGKHQSRGDEPKKKKKQQQQQLDVQQVQADKHQATGEVPQPIKITANSFEQPTMFEKPFTVMTNVEVGGEKRANKMDGVSDESKALVVGQMKDENMNESQVSEEKANKKKRKKVKENDESKASDVPIEQEKESSKRRKKHKSKSKNAEIPGNSPEAK